MDTAVERLQSASDRYRSVLRSLSDPSARAAARSGLAGATNSLARIQGEQLQFERSAATADSVLGGARRHERS